MPTDVVISDECLSEPMQAKRETMALKGPSWLWWAYFSLRSVGFFVSSIMGPGSVVGFVLTLMSGFSLVGLWGYLTSTAIGWRTFWRTYFAISLTLAVLVYVWLGWGAVTNTEGSGLFLALIGLWWAPEYIALRRYAFESDTLWAAGNASA